MSLYCIPSEPPPTRQYAFLGFASTSGAVSTPASVGARLPTAIDRTIVDPVIAPPERAEAEFSERLTYFSRRSYQPQDPYQPVRFPLSPSPAPPAAGTGCRQYFERDPVSGQHVLDDCICGSPADNGPLLDNQSGDGSGNVKEEGGSAGARFATFNRLDKVDMTAWTVWMNILRRIPHATLSVYTGDTASDHKGDITSEDKTDAPDTVIRHSLQGVNMTWELPIHGASQYTNISQAVTVIERLRAYAAQQGVHPGRVRAAPRMARPDHLARLGSDVDVLLDTLSYGAHTTAADALFRGIPVVTLAGNSFASRVAASLNHHYRARYTDTQRESRDRPSSFAHLATTYSLTEYEDVAVRLGTSTNLRHAIMQQQPLGSGDVESVQEQGGVADTGGCRRVFGLFDPRGFSRDVRRAVMADLEVVAATAPAEGRGGGKVSASYHTVV